MMNSQLTRSRAPSLRCSVQRAVMGGTACAVRSSLRWIVRWTPLALWFCGVVVMMASLAVSHLFSLAPLDRRNPKLVAELAALLPDERGDWASVHVLYTECRCSQRVFDHLYVSDRPTDLHEVVLLVGDDRDHAIERRLSGRGFEVIPVAPEMLRARFGIEGAPTFVLVDPARRVRYSGGYTIRQQGPDIRDLAIVREIRQGDDVADLPVFGCAVSKRLKALFDPFAIKR